MVEKINAEVFQEKIQDKVAVVDFSAVWCGPCQMLAPVLEELSDEYAGKIDFYNVDVDENPELAQQFGIMSIPALLIFKDGEKQEMLIGFSPKSELVTCFSKYIQ